MICWIRLNDFQDNDLRGEIKKKNLWKNLISTDKHCFYLTMETMWKIIKQASSIKCLEQYEWIGCKRIVDLRNSLGNIHIGISY